MGGEFLVPIFGIVGTFGSITVIFYLYLSSRNRERMALIERDKDASIFKSYSKTKRSNTLKYGILAVLIGLGLLLGHIMDRLNIINGEIAYFSMILIMGGSGLVGFYYLEDNNNDQPTDNQEDNFVD